MYPPVIYSLGTAVSGEDKTSIVSLLTHEHVGTLQLPFWDVALTELPLWEVGDGRLQTATFEAATPSHNANFNSPPDYVQCTLKERTSYLPVSSHIGLGVLPHATSDRPPAFVPPSRIVASNNHTTPLSDHTSSCDGEYAKVAQATEGYWAGYLAPLDFINEYMTSGYATEPTPQDIKFPLCHDDDRHERSVEDFLHYIRESGLCPDGVKFHVVAAQPLEDLSQTQAGRHAEAPSSTSPHSDDIVSFSWHDPGLFIEFTKHGDPFHDQPEVVTELGTIEKLERQSILTRGRLALYAREVFKHQHRTHILQLFIFGNHARFIRWDRAGVSVSAKFDYLVDPHPLEVFLRVYGRMSEVERGWDRTVSVATAEECTRFENACKAWTLLLPANKELREAWEINPATNVVVALDSSWPTYKVTLDPTASKEGVEDALIIKRPFHMLKGQVVGQGTRRYLAYSTKWSMLAIFKDGWRCDDNIHFAEATAYDTFKKSIVVGNVVPRALACGDVVGNVTRTNELVASKSVQMLGNMTYKTVITKHSLRQHRIVQEVACAVECLRSIKDMISVIWHCYLTLQNQPFWSIIIHRNITPSNIIARPDPGRVQWRGYLNDWDACAYEGWRLVGEQGLGHVDLDERWKYLSIDQLEDPLKPHDILDDLQALFWVLLWVTSPSDSSQAALLRVFTEQSTKEIDGRTYRVGGRAKKTMLLNGVNQHKELSSSGQLQSSSVAWLLMTMMTHWGEYYGLKKELDQIGITGIYGAYNLPRSGPLVVSDPASTEAQASAARLSVAQRFVNKYNQVCSPLFWHSMFAQADQLDKWPLGMGIRTVRYTSTPGDAKKQGGGAAAAMAKELRRLCAQQTIMASRSTGADVNRDDDGNGSSASAVLRSVQSPEKCSPSSAVQASQSQVTSSAVGEQTSIAAANEDVDASTIIAQTDTPRTATLHQRRKYRNRMRRL